MAVAIAMGQIVPILATLALFRKEEGAVGPISLGERRQGVLGRYLFAFSLSVGCTLLQLLLLCALVEAGQLSGSLFALFLSTLYALVVLEISLPLFYALGASRGKPWFFLLVLVPVALLALVLYRGLWQERYSIFVLLQLFLGILLALCAGVYSFRVATGFALHCLDEK